MTAAPAPMTLQDAFEKAVAHEQEGRLDDAERLLSQILATVPDQPDALHELGVLAARRKNFAEAAGLIERALQTGNRPGLYYRNICEVYRRLGRLDEAIDAANRAVDLSPNDPHSLVNLAIIYYSSGRFADGAVASERAIAVAPDLPNAHFELAECLLVQGNFERGLEEYEWRFKIAGANLPIPAQIMESRHWDGRPLDGTLLLIADQGFGDVIQFARFIPWAQGICPNLVVASAQEMHPVLRQILPGVRVIDRWEAIPPFAAHSSLSGLPRLYGIRLDNIPAPCPYLRADPERVGRWRAKLAALTPHGARCIGIVWAGRPTHNNDFNRSIALADLAPLAALKNTVLVSLQKGEAQAQIGRYFGAAPLLNLGPELADYEDTMAVLECLDVTVTVDTSVGHLAAAMSRPVWVMVPFAPDWRWLLNRSDSPWYPSLRLFRQPAPGRWAPVVAEIAALLKDLSPGRQQPALIDRLSPSQPAAIKNDTRARRR